VRTSSLAKEVLLTEKRGLLDIVRTQINATFVTFLRPFQFMINNIFSYIKEITVKLKKLLPISENKFTIQCTVIKEHALDGRQEKNIFLYIKESTPALGPTQPTVQWLPMELSTGVQQPECESEYSLPPTAKVKNIWNFIVKCNMRQTQLYYCIKYLIIHINNYYPRTRDLALLLPP
jgi:hypothetical protein